MKTPTPFSRPKILARLTAAIFSLYVVNAGATTFEQSPMLGIGSSYPPNVLLGLSVEFPTAGAAYQKKGVGITIDNHMVLTDEAFRNNTYLGYFDPDKCYSYNTGGGYFTPTRLAPANRYCTGEFSGNALNWMTMTTIDIFRQVMTGGNRALGLETTPQAYQNGDAVGKTILRRAFVNRDQNGIYSLFRRAVERNLAYKIFPSSVLSQMPASGNLLLRNEGFQVALGNSYLKSFTGNPGVYNVQVEVCKPDIPEKNCRAYSATNLKPEGLMQEYRQKMRFSVFGYLNSNSIYPAGKQINGGVMRARMKSLAGETTADGIVLGNEINTQTGQFETNPDQQDASASGVSNSGVINYLNKFGDSGKYRDSDPAAELYYAGLRYFRNKGNLSEYTKAIKTGDTTANNTAKDNFPVIENWNDPLLRQGETEASKEAVCRPNFLLYIGDTFTHHDNDLPNAYRPTGADLPTPVIPNDDVETETYLQKAANAESAFILTDSRGRKQFGAWGGYSYGSIVGLAYWARTNDIRATMAGNQTIRTIMVDVLEYGEYKSTGSTWNDNVFYWAAKYGGFNDQENEDKGLLPVLKPNSDPKSRAQWTSDPVGSTSLPAFRDGVPNTYGAAADPESLTNVLRKSFKNIGAKSDTPTQTALGLDLNAAGVMDVSANTLIMQSSYKQNEFGWQGDVIAYRSSDVFGNLSNNPPTPAWKLSDRLTNYRYNWNNRNVWARTTGGVYQFSRANATTFAPALALGNQGRAIDDSANLIEYVLGSDQYEESAGASFRKRPDNGLLGTVVNSAIAVVKAPQSESLKECKYTNFNTVKNRKTLYAFAANDGMLHIADHDGNEQFAYLPADTLPKLKQFAETGQPHFFINDGSPVAAEVCFASGSRKEAKSVIVGTTGRGGNSVYAVDATNMGASTTPGQANVMWEFNASDDSGLGLTVHKPVITNVMIGGQSVPVAVVSSGYNAAGGEGYIYILRLDKGSNNWSQGTNYWKVKLGSTGVGMPKVVDTDNDGNLDRIYVGDESGVMWRIDYANGAWQAAKKLFIGTQPITGAPDVFKNADNYTIVFSTGKYFDASDASATQQNYAYGLFDKDGSTISDSQLLAQSATLTNPVASLGSAGNSKVYYSTTQNTLTAGTHKGWKLQMPEGFISISDALIRRNRTAQFSAFKVGSGGTIDANATGNVCVADSGESATIEVDVRTGAMYKDAVFDTNNDKKFVLKDGDMLAGMVVEKGRIALFPAVATVNINGKQYDVVLKMGDDGKFSVEFLNRFAKGVRRISWREIF
ncbi:pilus assembly protein [Neisseria sp.]|uniref:pilus assembly protein n=1 Tax=Neisseria sp. TaxID=192066 RepID=UPI0026DAE94A|nr:PilC/PilY family type IV pilus protein [Neisseria sp.]MDO4226300.1 PilC/PilY family type IV pilus protein [Neisseria sp.]